MLSASKGAIQVTKIKKDERTTNKLLLFVFL